MCGILNWKDSQMNIHIGHSGYYTLKNLMGALKISLVGGQSYHQ